ncbi:MAG: hypothetical protein DRR08_23265 [Candidatus Parabeggiatoa sp. nov. 2]|nr:MAG: hypothetical protein B6247_17695 [Beggiatoa sp. 4572_84]RKZ55823.1 MAG: hypothetical protein DRR08_23265 [Gammaproteobacteria bacterium]
MYNETSFWNAYYADKRIILYQNDFLVMKATHSFSPIGFSARHSLFLIFKTSKKLIGGKSQPFLKIASTDK